MPGLTLQQLQGLGAKPTAPQGQQGGGLTLQQLQQMGAKQGSQPTPALAQAPQPQQQPQTSLVDKIGQVTDPGQLGIGALKGVGSTVAGLASLGEKLITRPIDLAVSWITGRPSPLPVSGPTEGENFAQQHLQANGLGQKLGKGAEQVAELLLPTGLEEQGANLASKIAPKASGLAADALKLGGKALGGAVDFGGKAAIQTGGNPQETANAALLGGAFPVAGAALGKVASVAGKGALELLGKTTGAGEASLREAFNNPNVIKFARSAGSQGGIEALQEQALQEAKSGLGKIKEARGSAYTKALEGVKAIKSEIDPIVQGTRDKAKELLTEAGVKIKSGKLLNNLDFGTSVIEKGQGSVTKAVNDVMKWTENTPAGLDKLKKKLASHLNEVRDAPGAYQIVKGLRDSVREGLENGVKGYKEMTSGYHSASNLIEDLQKTMSLGDKASKETALKKILNAMRQDNGLRQDMLRTLGTAGGKDVIGKVAGAQVAPLAARGMAGVIEGPGAGFGIGASLLNPAHIPALLAYLATSSPRLMAEAISLLGASKGRILTPVMKKGLQALIQEASRQNDSQQPGQPMPQ